MVEVDSDMPDARGMVSRLTPDPHDVEDIDVPDMPPVAPIQMPLVPSLL